MLAMQLYKIGNTLKITYLDNNKIVYGVVFGYTGQDLIVDRTCKGRGWVPVNHPNVKIEII